jgi:hypothetical protein
VDSAFGTGAYALPVRAHADFTGITNVVLHTTLSYDLYLPDRQTRRVPDNVNQPITRNREEVKRDLGDIVSKYQDAILSCKALVCQACELWRQVERSDLGKRGLLIHPWRKKPTGPRIFSLSMYLIARFPVSGQEISSPSDNLYRLQGSLRQVEQCVRYKVYLCTNTGFLLKATVMFQHTCGASLRAAQGIDRLSRRAEERETWSTASRVSFFVAAGGRGVVIAQRALLCALRSGIRRAGCGRSHRPGSSAASSAARTV